MFTLSVPVECLDSEIHKVELTWWADRYELCLTLDTGAENPLV